MLKIVALISAIFVCGQALPLDVQNEVEERSLNDVIKNWEFHTLVNALYGQSSGSSKRGLSEIFDEIKGFYELSKLLDGNTDSKRSGNPIKDLFGALELMLKVNSGALPGFEKRNEGGLDLNGIVQSASEIYKLLTSGKLDGILPPGKRDEVERGLNELLNGNNPLNDLVSKVQGALQLYQLLGGNSDSKRSDNPLSDLVSKVQGALQLYQLLNGNSGSKRSDNPLSDLFNKAQAAWQLSQLLNGNSDSNGVTGIVNNVLQTLNITAGKRSGNGKDFFQLVYGVLNTLENATAQGFTPPGKRDGLFDPLLKVLGDFGNDIIHKLNPTAAKREFDVSNIVETITNLVNGFVNQGSAEKRQNLFHIFDNIFHPHLHSDSSSISNDTDVSKRDNILNTLYNMIYHPTSGSSDNTDSSSNDTNVSKRESFFEKIEHFLHPNFNSNSGSGSNDTDATKRGLLDIFSNLVADIKDDLHLTFSSDDEKRQLDLLSGLHKFNEDVVGFVDSLLHPSSSDDEKRQLLLLSGLHKFNEDVVGFVDNLLHSSSSSDDEKRDLLDTIHQNTLDFIDGLGSLLQSSSTSDDEKRDFLDTIHKINLEVIDGLGSFLQSSSSNGEGKRSVVSDAFEKIQGNLKEDFDHIVQVLNNVNN